MSWGLTLLTAAAAAISVSAASCTYPTGDADFYPPESPPFTLVHSDPADGALDQPLNPTLRLRFSDFPDPATVQPPALRILLGESEVKYKAEVDLLQKQAMVRPEGDLDAGKDYLIALSPDLRALSGNGLPEASTLHLRTGMSRLADPGPPPKVTLDDILHDKQDGLANRCVIPGVCHAPAPSGGPARGLDLSLPADQALRELTTTVARGSPERLLLVKPGEPENSYLLRKLLGWDGAVRIEGTGMPQRPGDPTKPSRLADATLTRLSDWIRQGAPP